MKKKIALLFCVLSCVLMMAGCSLVKENENFNKKTLKTNADQFIDSWFSADFDSAVTQYASSASDEIIAQYKEYASMQKKYQGISKKESTEYTINSDTATVSETVICKNGDKVVISVSFNEDGEFDTDTNGSYVFKIEPYKTLGQQMAKAGLNTAMCIAIVFAVLIFIAILISCFKFIGLIQNKKEVAAPVASAPAAAPVAAEPENLVDDLELVAVITAAIAASSETECTDGLIVRSIIRR